MGAKSAAPWGDRFWSKVRRQSDGCWLWAASLTTGGYGRFNLDGRVTEAHRLAYTLVKGEIPDGACVLHSCDVRACVNPAHLRLGTKVDNARDREERNRSHDRSGENNGRAKLTEEDVLLIRTSRGPRGTPVKMLAERFGVGASTIKRAARGENWRSV